MTEHEILSGRVAAFLWTGRLADAETLAMACYKRSIAIRWPLGTTVWALWLGEVARGRGELTDALRWFREAAVLAQSDDLGHPYRSFIGCLVALRSSAGCRDVVEARGLAMLAVSYNESAARPRAWMTLCRCCLAWMVFVLSRWCASVTEWFRS